MQLEVEELLATLEVALGDIHAESQITHSDVEIEIPPQSSKCDPLSIHFCASTEMQKQSFTFSRLITNELILQGLDINGGNSRNTLKGELTIN